MKFFSKYKKQILSVFLCVALFSCFLCFSFSSSAEVVNDVTTLVVDSVYMQGVSSYGSVALTSIGDSTWTYDTDLNISTPTVVGSRLSFSLSQDYTVPSYSGRPISLSFNFDFTVSDHGYLSLVPENADLSDSAIFTGGFAGFLFTDGTQATIFQDSFILFDEQLGEVVDPTSDAYWEIRREDGPWDFSIYILFDLTPYIGKTIYQSFVSFPVSAGTIYYSNQNLSSYLTIRDISANIDFAYSPFQDVVQDDLTDIKDSLSGVNNKLDSLNSTMNTIDQDINRVNQNLDQTNETLGNIDQGIQDILKPSTPSVDFKNQWNDYFANNPMPDISNLPLYDMSNLMTLLADSSQVIRGIFSPFFLRDYQVTVPLINGFSNIKLDPVATYVSLSFALSLSILIIGILKGSRG